MTTDANLPKPVDDQLPESLLRTAFETVGEAIIIINHTSIVLMANPEIEHVFGYLPEELMGKHLHTIMPEQYRAAHSAGLQRYLTTGVANVLGIRLELEGLKKDGTVFPLEIRIKPTFVNEQYFFTAAIRDITQRRAQEIQLKEQKAQLTTRNQQLERVNQFLAFTLTHMETVLNHGAPKDELLSYIQQIKTQFAALDQDAKKSNA